MPKISHDAVPQSLTDALDLDEENGMQLPLADAEIDFV